jgi:hypothetical protein
MVAFAIVLIVRGSAIFNVTWAQDDFLQLYDPHGDLYSALNMAMLRPSVSWITDLVSWLGVTHPTNGSLWSALDAGAMVVFGLALRRLWIPGSSSLIGIITALIFALFPGLNNLWHYQVNHPSMTAHYCLGAYALVSYSKGGWRTVTSIAAIGLALGYQIMLSLFVVALFIFLATRLPLLISQERRSIHNWRLALSPAFELAGCLFAGVIVYVIASKAAIQLSGLEQSSRTSLAGLDLVPGKVLHLIADLKRLLHGRGEPSLPANVKLIQLSLLATVLLASFLTALKQLRRWDQVISWTVILGMTLLAAGVAIRFPTIFFTYTKISFDFIDGISTSRI